MVPAVVKAHVLRTDTWRCLQFAGFKAVSGGLLSAYVYRMPEMNGAWVDGVN
mgnify:CR=1 FL=1